jgi:hypothetical protein
MGTSDVDIGLVVDYHTVTGVVVIGIVRDRGSPAMHELNPAGDASVTATWTELFCVAGAAAISLATFLATFEATWKSLYDTVAAWPAAHRTGVYEVFKVFGENAEQKL